MRYLAGRLFEGPGWRDGWLSIEGGVIADKSFTDSKPPEAPAASGFILPGLFNAHCHLGDSFIENPPPLSIGELVAPPNGYKHRALASASRGDIVDGIQGSIKSMIASGTTGFCDFREQGLEGAGMLAEALQGLPAKGFCLGRPDQSRHDPEEVAGILDSCDGIGLSGLCDMDYSVAEKIAAQAKSAGKVLALHASECEREDISLILGLNPDFIVHMASAGEGDFKAVAGSGTPIVVCPRANSRFGLKPDIAGMIKAGCKVWLGTDNAMLASPSLLDELKFAAEQYRGEVELDSLINMCLDAGKTLNQTSGYTLEIGAPATLVAVEASGGEDFEKALVRGPVIGAVYINGEDILLDAVGK